MARFASKQTSRLMGAVFALAFGLWLAAPPCVLPASAEAPAGQAVQAQAEGAQPSKASAPKIFGSVAFRMSLKKQQNWLSVLERNQKSPVFSEQRRLARGVTWEQLRQRLSGLPRLDILREVNRFWNAWPYRSDREVWKKEDYWAIPAEFLQRSGDCEDFCIAKYFTLRELGLPACDMRIVVVKENIRNIAHAVLVVFDGSDAYVLDNLSDNVRPMHRVRNYTPHFSVNEEGRWMHVKAKPAPRGTAAGESIHGKKTAR